MHEYKIAVIIGSLRRESLNRKLAGGVIKLGPADFSFRDVQIGDLPPYNQDDDASQAPPVKRLKAEIKGANGLLFVTPEYNRSIRACSRTPLTMPHGLTGRAPGPASRPA
jgi:chromate reductase, NAD(P)H dehydrogenase (quinone)